SLYCPLMRPGRRGAGLCLAAGIVGIVGFVGIAPSEAAPTLTTPTLDGGFGDWAAVLANPENRVLDAPAGGLPEGAGAVPASRNVDTVAWTWDAPYLYLYIHRQATLSEFNYFWFHFDLDNDGRVANNSPLLTVAWWGNNQ